MKRTMRCLMVLVMLIATSPVCLPFASAESTGSTNAKIAFEEGVVEIVTGDLGDGVLDMSIDFGSHYLPTGTTTYTAADGAHTLRVLDSRTAAGGWTVTVEMGEFESEDESVAGFGGAIVLAEGSTSSNSATQGDPATVESPISIQSTGQSVLVITVPDGYSHGTFDTTWDDENIELTIDETAAMAAQIETDYVATMTWTLAFD